MGIAIRSAYQMALKYTKFIEPVKRVITSASRFSKFGSTFLRVLAQCWIPGSSDRRLQTHPIPLFPRLVLGALVQSVGRLRLMARRSPTDESMAAIPEPIIAPTVTSPG